MIQATNELILGIELNEEYSQLTYFHQSVRIPTTIGTKQDAEQVLLPMALFCDSSGNWDFWDERTQPEEKDSGFLFIRNIYGAAFHGEGLLVEGRSFTPSEVMTIYFRVWLDKLKLLRQNSQVYAMVTVKKLTEEWSEILVTALENNGLHRSQIYLQDYMSSFYYYTINQKKELWYQDVALLEYENEAIVGYVLHIDRSTRPAIAQVKQTAIQRMDDKVRAGRGEPEWRKEKDRLFFELLKKVFERRTISVSYLMGDYFNKSWAERSIQYLCFKRHAFQGRNLYSKGACYAAMERAGLITGRDIIFGGRDMIDRTFGMEMCIRGKNTYYPMIRAGVNWYEAHHVCEFILNHEREIRVISQPMTQGESVVHMMRLPGLPKRPDRTIRLRMTVYFTSPTKCHLEVEDMGFGGFFRSTGMIWKRTIFL